MTKSPEKIILRVIIVLIMLALAVVGYSYMNRHALFSEIRAKAEQKIGSILRARVSISQIKMGILNEISLRELEITQDDKASMFSFFNVKRIVLKLNPLSFLFRRLDLQNTIVMDSPNFKIQLPEGVGTNFSWEPFFNWAKTEVIVQNGEAEYDFPAVGSRIAFSDINGKLTARGDDQFQIAFSGRSAGFLTGRLAIDGMIAQKNKDVELAFTFDDVSMEKSWVPLTHMTGCIRVRTDTVFFESLKVTLRNMTFVVDGSIKDYLSDNPQFDVYVSLENYKISRAVHITGYMKGREFSLDFTAFKRHYNVQGRYELLPGGVAVTGARINDAYDVDMHASFVDDRYSVKISSGERDVAFDFLYDKEHPQLELDLNHVTLFGFDIVMKGVIDIAIDRARGTVETDRIRCTLRTDLLVFNFVPLRDFAGMFTLSERGVDDVNFDWGAVYSLTGSMLFDELCTSDLTLSMKDFELKEIDRFCDKPLSLRFIGILNGKITIRESAFNPKIDGAVTIKNGMFRTFPYDVAEINFSGNKYELLLHDSKITKGSRSFYLKGTINFGLANIFNNVTIQTTERIIVWRGWDIGKDQTGDEVVMEKQLSENLALNAGTGLNERAESESGVESSVRLAYDLDKTRTLSVGASDDSEEQTLDVKHSIRF